MSTGTTSYNYSSTFRSCNFNCLHCPHRKLSLFDKLESSFLEILNQNKSTAHYRAGELLYKQGNKIQGLLCLQSGKVKEYKTAPSGNELIVSLKKPVDFIGFTELMIHSSHFNSAMALEDTEICIIEKKNFMKVFEASPLFSLRINTYLSRVIEDTQNHMLHLTQKHMRGRLAYALLYLKDFYGTRPQDSFINLSLKRSDLASLTNLTTANVIRTLASFAEEALIEIKGRDVRILDDARAIQVCEMN